MSNRKDESPEVTSFEVQRKKPIEEIGETDIELQQKMAKINLTFLEPTKRDAFTSKKIKVVAGKVEVVESFGLGKMFKVAMVAKVDDLDGLLKIFNRMDSYNVFRIYGERRIPDKGGLTKLVERNKREFPDPTGGTRLLLVDADDWKLAEPCPVENIGEAIEVYLKAHGLDYLSGCKMLICFSSSAWLNEDKMIEKLRAHIYFEMDEGVKLEELRSWAKAVNVRNGLKLIDSASLKGVQPDYFRSPIFVEGSDPLPVRRFLVGKGLVKSEAVRAEKADLRRHILARVATGAKFVGSDKGVCWSQTCKRFGHEHCHAVMRDAAAQMVFEYGTKIVEDEIDQWAMALYSSCWEYYGGGQGRDRSKDEETYDLAKAREGIVTALATGFGELRDTAWEKWQEFEGSEVLDSQAIELFLQVDRIRVWSKLSNQMRNNATGSGSGVTKSEFDRAVKRMTEPTEAMGDEVPLYVSQYRVLKAAGFGFHFSGPFVLSEWAGCNGVALNDDLEFIRAANRVLIQRDDKLLLNNRNVEGLLKYIDGVCESEVGVSCRIYRDHDKSCVWIDHGAGDKVYKIEPMMVTLMEMSECPVKFRRVRSAPFPDVTQSEVDKALLESKIDGPKWEAHRTRAKLGGRISERSFRTLRGWEVHCLLDYGEYAVLLLHGQAGSGKSYMAANTIWTVEPRFGAMGRFDPARWNHNQIVGNFPKDSEALGIAATSQYIIGADNIFDGESVENSKVLGSMTMLSTGGVFQARQHYSQTRNVEFKACNPCIATSLFDLVHVPMVHEDLLARLYPVEVQRREDSEQLTFKQVVENGLQKEMFLETLTAAAWVEAKVGGGSWRSEHRIGSFGAVMDCLFHGLDAAWMKQRFYKLDQVKLGERVPFVEKWMEKAKTEGGGRYLTKDVAGKFWAFEGDGAAARAGTLIARNKGSIERAYGVKLGVFHTKKGNGWQVKFG